AGQRVDPRVPDEVDPVDLVEGVLGGVPPPPEAAAAPAPARAEQARHLLLHRAALRGLARERHEDRRQADAPEGLVAGAPEALVVELLAGDLADGAAGEADRLGHGVRLAEDLGAHPAGRVDVDVRHAALVQVRPEVVGVPGRGGVAAVRVPQIGVMIISWTWASLMLICARTPAASAPTALPGLARPSLRTILPRRLVPEGSDVSAPGAYTTSPSMPAPAVDAEKACVIQGIERGASPSTSS